MKIARMLATTGITGVAMAGLVVSPALAWHPQAQITKSVQDVTSSSQTVSATAAVNVDSKTDNETASQILSVAPGDTLHYIIVVTNPAPPASNEDDDLANATVTDDLPQGVELTSNTPLMQTIADLAPGQSKTYEYDVTVTDQTNGDVLTNKACVTGSSADNDVTGLEACSSVSVKVQVPQQPKSTSTSTPSSTKPTTTPQQPTTLPNTGAGDLIIPAALVVGILGYVGYLLRLKRRTLKSYTNGL